MIDIYDSLMTIAEYHDVVVCDFLASTQISISLDDEHDEHIYIYIYNPEH